MPRKKKPLAPNEFLFKIDAFTPATLPIDRLAAYVHHFAYLLGNEAHVHLMSIEKSSCALRGVVDDPAIPKVRDRAHRVNDGTAPRLAISAKDEIDNLLAADNAIGEIFLGDTKVIEFPGRRRRTAEEIGPVQRKTSIDGQIYSIGGKDETINVKLRHGGKELACVVSLETARKLGPYLLGPPIRLTGTGNWYRVDGNWSMRSFTADTFDELDTSSLPGSLSRIRAILYGLSSSDFMATMEELRRE